MSGEKTVVMGATTNPSRYAYIVASQLIAAGEETVLLGIRKGTVDGVEIQDIRSLPEIDDVDTITLYLGPQNQEPYLDYILNLHPKRVIFNPGTENMAFANQLRDAGIEVLNACTMVMLSIGNYRTAHAN